MANQIPEVKEQYGLTRAQVDAAVWVIDAVGQKWTGAAAVNRVLRECGPLWTMVAQLYTFPPLRWLEDLGYQLVADHRGQLAQFYSATPECERPNVTCE